MPSLLSYGDQAFWVSNGTKDLLYEAVLEMARRSDLEAHKGLQEEGRLVGCYGVSGMGFELEAFEECLAGKAHFKDVVAQHFQVIHEMCGGHEVCVHTMTKVFNWIWFLLDGGQCNDSSGKHPALHEMDPAPSLGR